VNSNVVKGNIMLLKLVSCDTSVVEMQSVGFHNGNVIQPIQFHHRPSLNLTVKFQRDGG